MIAYDHIARAWCCHAPTGPQRTPCNALFSRVADASKHTHRKGTDMILTTRDVDYLAHTTQAIADGKLIGLTNRCPECNDVADEVAHIVARTPLGTTAVLIGCEGYWTVDPARVGMERGDWQPTGSVDFTRAVETAEVAFWASLTQSYPDVTTGDVSPDAAMALEQAMTTAARQWLRENEPATRAEVCAVIRAEMDGWERGFLGATCGIAKAIVEGRLDPAVADLLGEPTVIADHADLDADRFTTEDVTVAVDAIRSLVGGGDVDSNESGNTATWLIYEETFDYAGTSLGAFCKGLVVHAPTVADAANLIVEAWA